MVTKISLFPPVEFKIVMRGLFQTVTLYNSSSHLTITL